MREKFQICYMVIFFIMGILISGNIELGLPIPLWALVIERVSGFLTVGKIIYWLKRGEI